MSLVKWAFIALLLLPLLEIAAFVLIAFAIGWFWATCLFLATTVVGLFVLKRASRRDLDRLRSKVSRDGFDAMNLSRPGGGALFGGILLIFPGFITDVVGALLLVPAIRRRLGAMIAHRFETRRDARQPSVIDLTPQEWRQVSQKSIEDGPTEKRVP